MTPTYLLRSIFNPFASALQPSTMHLAILTGLTSLLAMHAPSVMAAPLNLSHVAYTQNLQPNVLFSVDDSISIDWETMTSGQWNAGAYLNNSPAFLMSGDGLYESLLSTPECTYISFAYIWNNKDNVWKNACRSFVVENFLDQTEFDWRIFSSDFNKIYYNPMITYLPWHGYPDADFSEVRSHPDQSQSGYKMTRNLGSETFKFNIWRDTAGFSGEQPSPLKATRQANGVVDLWDSFIEFEVSANSITVKEHALAPNAGKGCEAITDKNPGHYARCFNGKVNVKAWDRPFGRTIAEEQQNIANWYQYHRRRSFALRHLVAQLIQKFPEFRYGLDFTTDYNNKFTPVLGKEENTAIHNQKLLTTLYEYTQQNAGTPLATALDRAGQYFSGQLKNHKSPIIHSCQANYAVMLSDGFWNDHRRYKGQAQGDLDGDGAAGPFGNTALADIATYYFQRDLAPTLKNDFSLQRSVCKSVQPPQHQHMSTIGVTFGPFGNLKTDAQGCWPEPALKANDDWGNPLADPFSEDVTSENLLARIDDLWHAAYNSNGFFTASTQPQVLMDELSKVFQSISQLNSTGAAGTLASGNLNADNSYVVSSYDIEDNTGSLASYASIPATGALATTPRWNTVTMNGGSRFVKGQRNLYGYNSETGQPVDLSQNKSASALSARQRAVLFPTDAPPQQMQRTQAWLDQLQIAPLGALVHSNPTFVGQPSRSKSQQSDDVKAGYLKFQQAQKTNLKRDMVYIGSNRGLLHGFDLQTGQELFAYLPDALLSANLPAKNKAYTSSMDGPIVAEDVYFADAGKWRTVIVAGFRHGASGYVALDVTNPEGFLNASQGVKQVLWEYSNQGNAGVKNPLLGDSYSKAAIGRMANGRWLAIFGNGYNSAQGEAALIMLDMETGELVHQMTTGAGPAADPLNLNRDNAMAEPALIDKDQDGIVDVIYAGDFFGNLYAFDVQSKNPADWRSKFGQASKATPLYAVPGAPITTRPAVMRSGEPGGLLIIAGTGQNVTGQTSKAPDNQLFAVIDRNKPVDARASMPEIQLKAVTEGWQLTPTKNANENPSDQPVAGWRMPLTGPAAGFQITYQPLVELGELTVMLTRPDYDVCGLGNSASALLKLNPLTGLSLERSLFLNEDLSPRFPDQTVDGLVLENTLLQGISLAGTSISDAIIGTDASGKVIAVRTSPAPHRDGRQRFRRLFD